MRFKKLFSEIFEKVHYERYAETKRSGDMYTVIYTNDYLSSAWSFSLCKTGE